MNINYIIAFNSSFFFVKLLAQILQICSYVGLFFSRHIRDTSLRAAPLNNGCTKWYQGRYRICIPTEISIAQLLKIATPRIRDGAIENGIPREVLPVVSVQVGTQIQISNIYFSKSQNITSM